MAELSSPADSNKDAGDVKTLRRLLLMVVVFALLVVGAGVWWLRHPLPLKAAPVDVSIEPGRTPRGVVQDIVAAGVQVEPLALYAWFRLSGQSRLIRAGSYELTLGTTPESLLKKLVRGDETLRALTLVEGWTLRQVRDALAGADDLRHDTAGLSDDDLMKLLGRPCVPPEGHFFPDTYTYAKGSPESAVLRRALHAMDVRLAAAWALRAPTTPLKSPEQALILASIVEKETGKAADRGLIAGVFINRLRVGMPLQTDPTVIYGMGQAFDGKLHRSDLRADTPFNTYTRAGLPPTPISMPGRASLMAAVRPDPTDALYFVARGDGSSQFSPNLDEHNRAVDRYQRRGKSESGG
jgi:UPF0755 protein